jgi:hypothetical protein
MPPQSKGNVDRFEHRKKAVCLLRRFETLHLGSVAKFERAGNFYLDWDGFLGVVAAKKVTSDL